MEFLPPAELARREVVELLRHAGVAPMLAAHAVSDDDHAQAEADAQVARVLQAYRQVGLVPCVWPLLRDRDGYWPSAYNAGQVRTRVLSLIAAAERAGAPFRPGDVVAVDLEPPLLLGVRTLLRGCPAARFDAAQEVLRGLCGDLRRLGLRTLAVAYPLVSADGAEPVWQRRCVAPLRCGWDRVAIMTYSSIITGYSRGLLSLGAARRYGYQAQAALGRAFPGQAGAFIGICGTGKLGDEKAHDRPAALRADAAAARAAGAVEVTAFCLEGILQQPDPLAWLKALDAQEQVPPIGLRGILGDLCHLGAQVLSRGLGAVGG